MNSQLALDVWSLEEQLATAKDATERSTAGLLDVAGVLDQTLAEYRRTAAVADATARALADQRVIVRNGRGVVARLRDQLTDARAALAASITRMDRNRGGDFGVYATGCRPDDGGARPLSGVTSGTVIA